MRGIVHIPEEHSTWKLVANIIIVSFTGSSGTDDISYSRTYAM